MSREEIEARKELSRPWYWWGAATFFRCPWNEKPEDCDIGLVGVPHSTGNGSTERDQHLGPRSIRHVSADIVCPMPTVDSPNQIRIGAYVRDAQPYCGLPARPMSNT